ncbi:tyrosine-type recombinase/integrase [Bacillus yapensis]|nr:tyrosine-type recombinase/integrase [Bacillus yapensis]
MKLFEENMKKHKRIKKEKKMINLDKRTEKQLKLIISNQDQSIEHFFEQNPYFKKDIWLDVEIPVQYDPPDYATHHKITFNFNNSLMGDETKYYFAHRLLDEKMSPLTLFEGYYTSINHISNFINEFYPDISSFSKLIKEKVMSEYSTYLTEKGLKINQKTKDRIRSNRNYMALNLLTDFYNEFYDTREETDKDIWDVRELNIEYNEAANTTNKVDFTNIPTQFKDLIKKYLKFRVVTRQDLNFHIGIRYKKELLKFLTFLDKKYPDFKDLKQLSRSIIIEYIDYLRNKSTVMNKSSRVQQPPSETNIGTNLNILRKFLKDIQNFEWTEAPEKLVDRLIFSEDIPTRSRLSDREIKYIPDHIWDQVVANIDKLKAEYIPILLVMEASGFRGSDILSLNINCLERDNDDKWWLVGDQSKVKYKDHKVPISQEIAEVIIAQRELIKENSTEDNNPKNYLFPRLKGQRKGLPITTAVFNKNLNDLAKKAEIKDIDRDIYHFRNHAFRHRYGVTLINNGMNILHVQRLMAHASPEMTLVYAKIHDSTLRDEYFKAKKNAAIRLNPTGEVVPADLETQAHENGLELEWIRHNYDSIRMDHGVCIKSPKTKCDFLERTLEPPCIANKCRSFHVDGTFRDYYKSQIELLEKDIKLYIKQGKERSLEFAQKKKENYQKILDGIEQNGGFYGIPKEKRELTSEERTLVNR